MCVCVWGVKRLLKWRVRKLTSLIAQLCKQVEVRFEGKDCVFEAPSISVCSNPSKLDQARAFEASGWL